MTLEFVNFRGDQIPRYALAARQAGKPAKPKKKPAKPEAYHKGWRVTGVPPGAMEKARDDNARLCAMAAKSGGKPIPPFDPAEWLRKAKQKPVRSKPYGVQEAAVQCAQLAQKQGWLQVQITELKSGSEGSAFGGATC